jgi:hypothetical protein
MRRGGGRLRVEVVLGQRALPYLAPDRQLLLQVDGSSF